MFEPLLSLPLRSIENLASALRDGALSQELNSYTISQIAGSEAAPVIECLTQLRDKGLTSLQLSFVLLAIAEKARAIQEPSDLFDIVLSGPSVAGIPTRDTSATIISMVEKAETEILLVGYVVHRIRPLFSRIAERMKCIAGLKTRIIIDIPRKYGDTSLPQEIVRRFAKDFTEEHWPFDPKPELFYDKRSLEEDPLQRSSLHAKCVVVDRKSALVTSANFTEAAQQRNIELGIEIRHKDTAEKICRYFEGLLEAGVLVKHELAKIPAS